LTKMFFKNINQRQKTERNEKIGRTKKMRIKKEEPIPDEKIKN